MNTVARDVPLGFTQRRFPAGTHMCLVYDSEEERRRVMAEYLAAGVETGERVAYFADAGVDMALQWLAEAGVPAAAEERKGAVHVSAAESVCCPGGQFNPDLTFDALRTFSREADEAGHDGVRVSGEMTWALRGIPGSERLLEYEAKATHVLQECGITGICQYDASRWDGATILDILRVHPWMVVRSQVLENPFYVPPEEYLREHYGER